MTIRRRNAQGFSTPAEVGDWYDKKYTEMSGGWHTPPEEIDAHLDALGLPQDARGLSIIDLGFGDGQLLIRAAMRKADCYGVDLSNVGREFAKLAYAKLVLDIGQVGTFDLHHARMEDTKFAGNAFDFAISLGSMEHALDIPAAVGEMARILKPGGKFLLYVPNEEWIHEDQPLETTAPSSWWIFLLNAHGLVVEGDTKMNDNNRITGFKRS